MEYNSLLLVETFKHLLFLKTNLEHFSSYTPPSPNFPLRRSGLGEAELGVSAQKPQKAAPGDGYLDERSGQSVLS